PVVLRRLPGHGRRRPDLCPEPGPAATEPAQERLPAGAAAHVGRRPDPGALADLPRRPDQRARLYRDLMAGRAGRPPVGEPALEDPVPAVRHRDQWRPRHVPDTDIARRAAALLRPLPEGRAQRLPEDAPHPGAVD